MQLADSVKDVVQSALPALRQKEPRQSPYLRRRTHSLAWLRFASSRRSAITSETRSPCRYIISISK